MAIQLSVSFQPSTDNGTTAIEDVLNTIQKVSTPQNKLIVVFDEFQSILEIDKNMDKQLRYFKSYIADRLKDVSEQPTQIADEILVFTSCHPYYTQQLSFAVWNNLVAGKNEDVLQLAVEDIITTHDLDYERLWLNFN